MKKILILVIALVVVAALGSWYVMNKNGSAASTTTAAQPAAATTTVAAQGAVVFGITDVTGAIQNVSEVTLGISKIELYSETKGWVALPANAQSYDLIALKASGQTKVFAAAPVTPDTYSKARVTMGEVSVKTKAGKVAKAATITSTLDVSAPIKVSANEVTAVKLDFLADKSLHTTAKGDYVFAPVVHVTATSNAIGGVDAQGLVTVTGGAVDFDSTLGSDIDGSLKADFVLGQETKLDLDATGAVNIIGSIKAASTLKTNTAAGATVGGVVDTEVKGTVSGVLNQ